jgi:hypothetical protein
MYCNLSTPQVKDVIEVNTYQIRIALNHHILNIIPRKDNFLRVIN